MNTLLQGLEDVLLDLHWIEIKMARSLQNYRLNLDETGLLLVEIGQLVNPYKNDFKFYLK